MTANKTLILKQFSIEELKEELQRRRTLERAKVHLPSAERALEKAQAKVKAYREAVAEEKEMNKL